MIAAIRRTSINSQKDSFQIRREQLEDPEIQEKVINFFKENINSSEVECWKSSFDDEPCFEFRSRVFIEETDEDFKERLEQHLKNNLDSIKVNLEKARAIEEQINNL